MEQELHALAKWKINQRHRHYFITGLYLHYNYWPPLQIQQVIRFTGVSE